MEIPPDEIQIFTEAILIVDGFARSAYLDRVCKNDLALRKRLDELILAHLQSLSVLDDFSMNSNWTVDGIASTPSSDSKVEVGTVIAGRYRLLESIGRGGMGEVWVAQQSEPVSRRVAIKLIQTGMDSQQVLARFEAERQALAVMDHPNIAKIFDGGTTSFGRPFFAMELVKGVMITEYCDACQLTVRERLELFVQICSAVQHAHQKGLIHRDLKPSNILVTEQDGKPVCKVIDFGLAKAVQGSESLTEASLHTAFGAVIGTPMYMAPEQLRVSQQDVDTRADLYSLGVILYELLTGSTPLELDRIKKAAWDEILKMIRDEDPPTPSQRLSSSQSLPIVAARRHSDPARLSKLVRGELDWIIMKALDKDRNRRYESASGFGLDIQRYLTGEAILAAPPTRFYKLRKFASKHRGLVSIVMLVSLTLLGGILGTSYGLLNAQQATMAERLAKSEALKKQKEAEEQRKRAEAREQSAIDAVKRFGEVVSKNPELKNNPALEDLRKTLLQDSLSFFQSLRDELEAEKNPETNSLEKLAEVALDLGDLTKEIGNQEDALNAYQQSLFIRQRLLDRRVSDLPLRHNKAISHLKIAAAHFVMGQDELALEHDQEAIKLLEQANIESPDNLVIRRDLANVSNHLGLLYGKVGDLDRSLSSHKKALDASEQLIALAPNNEQYQLDVTRVRQNLAVVFADQGKYEQALAESKKSLNQIEGLLHLQPNSASYQSMLAVILGNTSRWEAESLGVKVALPTMLRAIETNKVLVQNHPTNQVYKYDLANAYYGAGSYYENLYQRSEAKVCIDLSIELNEQLVRDNPTVSDYVMMLAKGCSKKAGFFVDDGNIEEAKAYYERALALREEIVKRTPERNNYRIDWALSYSNYGNMLGNTDLDAALDAYYRSIEIMEKLVSDHPEMADNRRWLATVLENAAILEYRAMKMDSCREHLLQAEAEINVALIASPTAENYQSVLKLIYSMMVLLDDPEHSPRAKKSVVEMLKKSPKCIPLESRIGEILTEKPVPKLGELFGFANYSYDTLRFSLATQIYKLLLDQYPDIPPTQKSEFRYNGACCAALAASGYSYEETLNGPQKKQLGEQAIDWLRIELETLRTQLKDASIQQRKKIIVTLKHWQTDTDLSCFRESIRIQGLDDALQSECLSFWQNVAEVLQKAESYPNQNQNNPSLQTPSKDKE